MDYQFINKHIKSALTELNLANDIPFVVELIRDDKLGDFSSNVCMVLAKKCAKTPAEIGALIQPILLKHREYYEKVEYVNPGFLNFFLKKPMYKKVIDYYAKPDFSFQKLPVSERTNFNVEYVSANPTGFLHLGHVRNGLIGDVLSRLLAVCGNEVTTEFWINNLGNQVDLFTKSIFARYLQSYKIDVPFAENGYQGQEPFIVAKKLREKYGKKFAKVTLDWENGFSDPKVYRTIMNFALSSMLKEAKSDLAKIGVKISVWTSEKKLYGTGIFDYVREKYLKDVVYEKDGALWIKSTLGGDDKDRVLLKSNGATTYFVTDIINHYNKLQRGAVKMIDVWGADQTGQVKKLRFALNHFCDANNQFIVVLHQMVRLFKDGQEVRFSKRKGQTLTIPDLLKIFDVDAVRWLILSQSVSSPIVIDIKTEKKKNLNNTVYYIQYAYARACQILKKVEKAYEIHECKNFDLLTDHRERRLIVQMLSFETLLHKINYSYELHLLCTFLNSLAHVFNSWYDDCHVLSSSPELMMQRYWLTKAVANLMKNLLSLLGISARKSMERLKK